MTNSRPDERDPNEADEGSDDVEQASIDSFPASDAPSWTPVQRVGQAADDPRELDDEGDRPDKGVTQPPA